MDTIYKLSTAVTMLAVLLAPTAALAHADNGNDNDDNNGNSASGIISGIVFNDLNTNDTYDSGEPLLANVTVVLHEGTDYNGDVVATDVTDAGGNYFFDGLHNGHQYFVEEIIPTGYDQTTSDAAKHITGSNNDVTLNFANVAVVAPYVPQTGGLAIKKVVVGGTATPDMFSFSLNGAASTTFNTNGENDYFAIATGTYAIAETATTTYTASYDNCSGTIAANATSTCTITNTYITPASTNTDSGSGTTGGNGGPSSSDTNTTTNTGGSNGGGGGGGGGYIASGPLSIGYVNSSSGGLVLGTSTEATDDTSCGALLSTFMREGMHNDKGEVTKLQNFLNKELGLHLSASGYFGSQTTAAVKAFQIKYQSDVLDPWKPFGFAGNPTGYVYKTTRHKINELACSMFNEPAPQLP